MSSSPRRRGRDHRLRARRTASGLEASLPIKEYHCGGTALGMSMSSMCKTRVAVESFARGARNGMEKLHARSFHPSPALTLPRTALARKRRCETVRTSIAEATANAKDAPMFSEIYAPRCKHICPGVIVAHTTTQTQQRRSGTRGPGWIESFCATGA